MKTAEVAIEHVLTGLLALCAFGLPFARWYGLDGKSLGSGNERLIGILGLAYLFGVVFDKIADILLHPFEQRLRLRLAGKLRDRKPGPGKDAFPQDALEFSLREQGGGRLEWMDSLRSRIRTLRGLAVLGLPAALGIALYQTTPDDYDPSGQSLGNLFPYLAIALNLFFILASLVLSMPFRIQRTSKPSGEANQRKTLFPILRTDELPEVREDREKALGKANWRVCIHAGPYVFMQAASVLAVAVIACSPPLCSPLSCSQPYRCVVLAVAGTASVVLALWVWHRITKTYMDFVAQGLPLPTTNEAATPTPRKR